MYKSNSLWDQEQDDYRRNEESPIGAGYENSDGNPSYNGNSGDYNSGGDSSDVYSSTKADEKDKKDEEKTGIEQQIDNQEEKPKSN